MKAQLCLTECFESWTQALDNGYGSGVLYLDYGKAFISVADKRMFKLVWMHG